MKKNKLYKITIILLMILMIPFNVYAKDNIILNRSDNGKNSVNLVLENVNTIAHAFQISLKIEGAKYDSITPSQNINKSGRIDIKIKNDIITIYVSSKKDLVNEEGNIEIGDLKVKGTVGNTFNIIPADNANFKLVTYKNDKISLGTMNYTGDESFTLVEDLIADNNNQNNNNNNNNSNQNNNGQNSNGQNSNNNSVGNTVNGNNNSTNNNLVGETTNSINRDENNNIINDEKSNADNSSLEDNVEEEKEKENDNEEVEVSINNDKSNVESYGIDRDKISEKDSIKNYIFLIISSI